MEISFLGREPICYATATKEEDKDIKDDTFVFPSDHFGLVATIVNTTK